MNAAATTSQMPKKMSGKHTPMSKPMSTPTMLRMPTRPHKFKPKSNASIQPPKKSRSGPSGKSGKSGKRKPKMLVDATAVDAA